VGSMSTEKDNIKKVAIGCKIFGIDEDAGRSGGVGGQATAYCNLVAIFLFHKRQTIP